MSTEKEHDWKDRRDESAKRYIETLGNVLKTELEGLQFKAGWNAGRRDALLEMQSECVVESPKEEDQK